MSIAPNTPAIADEPGVQDGRRNRTVATRKRIVNALIELIKEGQVAPTAEDVSVRANVGLRTVFRHFDDMETLYREINNELQGTVQSMVHMEFESDNWQERLLEGIRVRARLYESITPFFRSAQVHRHKSTLIDANIRDGVGLERAILKKLLPKEIVADRPRFEALIMVLSPEAWVRLRQEQGLSFSAAVAAIQMVAKRLLPT
jgi:AcrR family transcriptional regulator